MNRGAGWVRNCQGKAEKNRYNILQKGEGEKMFAVNRVDPTCGCRSYVACPCARKKEQPESCAKVRENQNGPYTRISEYQHGPCPRMRED
jgi:hypothetical protein